MKYAKLLSVLALNEIAFKTPLFGGKPYCQLSEEAVENIENALAQKDTSALEQELLALKEEKAQFLEEIAQIKNAVNQSLTMNDIAQSESVSESILLLGQTCKAYGEKNAVHTTLENSGTPTQNPYQGVVNMNDEHNQIN